jgi:hypothetical protein
MTQDRSGTGMREEEPTNGTRPRNEVIDNRGRDGQEEVASESALGRWLARAGLVERGAGRPVRGESAKPSLYTAGGVRPDSYGQPSSTHTIDGEEARLIARAKQEGFFWGADKLPGIVQALGRKRAGGNEHDVYIVGESPNRLVIRSTAKDSYGLAFASPAQYLQRMADYNATFPELAIEMIGVSRAPVMGRLSDTHGNGVVWTAQPFVEGPEFHNQDDLTAAMQANGWDHVRDAEYRHRETGAVIDDAHTGNVLLTPEGGIVPIDVIVRQTM